MDNLTTGLTELAPERPDSHHVAAMSCYLAHVEGQQSIRSIAAARDLHPSTVMRRIRKIELMRDDPVVDQYLATLSPLMSRISQHPKGENNMTPQTQSIDTEEATKNKREEMRILRRMCETGAFMAVSQNMAKAVVMRVTEAGGQTRTAVTKAEMAGALVLKDWARCTKPGLISRYEVTPAGRAALKRALAQDEAKNMAHTGFSEAPSVFSEQHKEWGERVVSEKGTSKPRRLRVNLRESPLSVLGRKKGTDGQPFLAGDLVAAGERFREDFELSQIGPRVAQNWENFLTPRGGGSAGSGTGGFTSAHDRFSSALTALGPGLGDITMRCCCFLEGLEVAEKRMGWPARSGKIVLRIALQRLSAHYSDGAAPSLRKIG